MRRVSNWTRWTACGLMLISLCLGCKSLKGLAKYDNPVLKPPPRRITLDDSEVEQRIAMAAEEETQIQQTSAGGVDDTEVFNATVVARVNGAPVFAGEVLQHYGEYLRKARDKLNAEEYLQLREAIIQRDLRAHIERRLLVEKMRADLKPEQLKQLDSHVDAMFEKTLMVKLKNELGVNTRTELELALNERDTTLAAVRDSFATERLAQEYLFGNLERPDPPTRPELVAYYQAHLDDYKVSARVKWEQIQVTAGKTLSKSGAEQKIRAAQQELANGVAFAEVARKYSDGPTARSGGEWDWTRAGSLADSDLEQQLFQLAPGQLSEVYFGRGAFHIFRVIDRESEGRREFAEVQDEIQKLITDQREKDLPKNFVEKLYKEAIIESDYEYLEPDRNS